MTVELISRNSDGDQAVSPVVQGSTMTQGRDTVSANGRYVVFESSANNLVEGDTNNIRDVFWHDRVTGETRRVSVSSPDPVTGEVTQANQPTNHNTALGATISGDGRFVAFQSAATNLVAGDTNNQVDIFVHDTESGETERLDIETTNGLQPNGFSSNAALSHNGRFVTFSSTANNLVAGDSNNTTDIFWHDRQTGETRRVSVTSEGAQGTGASSSPSISGDGRYVVFQSSAILASNDTNPFGDIYVHDTQTGETRLVSVSNPGVPAANGLHTSGTISADGNWVAFSSGVNLTGDPNDTGNNIYLHHLPTGMTTRVDRSSPDENGDVTFSNGNSNFPSLSGDGRYIAWEEFGTNLIDGDTQPPPDIMVHDRITGQTVRVSQNADGVGANGSFSRAASISEDGSTIVFASNGTNLLLPIEDTNGREDVFAVSLLPGTIALELEEDPFVFTFRENSVVIEQTAATAGVGALDLGAIPLRVTAVGAPGAQIFTDAAQGLGVRSNGEPPGIAGQTVGGSERLRIDFDPASRFEFATAVSAVLDFGRVVTAGNQGRISVRAYDDGVEVASETFAIRNGDDQRRLFDPGVDFDTLEIGAGSGSATRFTLTGFHMDLAAPNDLLV